MSYVLLAKSTDEPVLKAYDDEVYGTFEAAQDAAQAAWIEGDDVLVGKVTAVAWEPPTCSAQTYAGSRYVDPEPPEYCENPAILGSEFCAGHAGGE